MVQQHTCTWYGMLCSNFHIYHCLLKNQRWKNQKIKTFPYLHVPTQKLTNKLETDLFFLGLSCVRYRAQLRNRVFFVVVSLGFMSLLNVWGHIATLPACSSGTLTNVLPYRNVMPQTQDMTPHPVTSIQTQGWPVAVLSIDVERHTGIHNYPFKYLWSDPIEESFPDLPHTPANAQLYDADRW